MIEIDFDRMTPRQRAAWDRLWDRLLADPKEQEAHSRIELGGTPGTRNGQGDTEETPPRAA